LPVLKRLDWSLFQYLYKTSFSSRGQQCVKNLRINQKLWNVLCRHINQNSFWLLFFNLQVKLSNNFAAVAVFSVYIVYRKHFLWSPDSTYVSNVVTSPLLRGSRQNL
jgi:hypothetical protein